ncbi:bifunctional diguanylate cyclase/phosphodiesterase [Rhodobium gokarnense]|uniref:Diguanylate cyclase (GGDEF)-like protein n=1 Tax=Rhodobium gokarnense TaxID=364296 RepID=A0ABT3HDE7_9HYPH|nr:EAL domain-containing protein [Rhodobium gokarnense]MCW2308410.1 diguanylate cyclase (GGDEF)-like protein [Rhodobium gokarnense]
MKKRATRLVSARIVLPISLLVASVVIVAVVAIAFWARQSDQATIQRDTVAVGNALNALIERLPQEQQSVFSGDEAYKKIVLDFDQLWTHRNIGQQLYRIHGHDVIAVVSAHQRPLYLMADGRKLPETQYERYRGEFAHLVTEVQKTNRNFLIQSIGTHDDRAPLRGVGPSKLVNKLHAVDLVLIDGQIGVASVMAVTPTITPKILDLRPASMVISVKFLSRPVLDQIASGAVVNSLHIHPVNEETPPQMSASFHEGPGEIPLIDNSGRHLGVLHWFSELPGTVLAAKASPLVMLAILTLVALTIFILNTARRAAREVEASEAKARHDAMHDQLTGLPNRSYLALQLADTLKVAIPGHIQIGCVRLDLDGFTEINDIYGHKVGDKLIVGISRRLRAAIGPQAFLARAGGDEFAILVMGIGDTDDMMAMCEKIMEAVREPFAIDGNRLVAIGSIGFAVAPDHGTSAEEILRRADMALHAAKKKHDNRIVQYFAAIEDHVHERQRLVHDLRQALTNGELYVCYQPLVSADDLSMVSVESLLRWRHPTRGEITPALFIPIAEEFGMIDEIGRWVLETSCREARHWNDLSVAVNISPMHLSQPDFVDQVIDITTRTGFDPQRLVIEVTEGIMLEYADAARRVFDQLRAVGAKIALDDFGTGYSSLSYLESFRFDKLKIDRSFLRNLETSPEAAAIVHTIIGLGNTLNTTIVAEGVETEAHCRFLQAAGCNELQGFLFSKPVTAPQIMRRMMMEQAVNRDLEFLRVAHGA